MSKSNHSLALTHEIVKSFASRPFATVDEVVELMSRISGDQGAAQKQHETIEHSAPPPLQLTADPALAAAAVAAAAPSEETPEIAAEAPAAAPEVTQEAAPEAPAKRGPGRPKKTAEATAEKPAKRGPGRPRKNPEVTAEAPAKRGPGRPRKTPEVVSEEAIEVAAEQPTQQPLTPAVPIEEAVKDDHVTCLDCGKEFSMLKRHLTQTHQMTTDEYRAKWGLSADFPLTAPNYSKQKSKYALSKGLGQYNRNTEEETVES